MDIYVIEKIFVFFSFSGKHICLDNGDQNCCLFCVRCKKLRPRPFKVSIHKHSEKNNQLYYPVHPFHWGRLFFFHGFMLLSQSWNQGTVCADAPSWCGLDSWIICIERWHKGFHLCICYRKWISGECVKHVELWRSLVTFESKTYGEKNTWFTEMINI